MSDRVSVNLGGIAYTMRPAYDAMRDIEGQVDLTLSEIYELHLLGRLKIEETVAIIWFACRAAGEKFDTVDAVGRAVFADKVTSPSMRKSIAEFLLACLYAPDEAKKKLEDEVLPTLEPTQGETG